VISNHESAIAEVAISVKRCTPNSEALLHLNTGMIFSHRNVSLAVSSGSYPWLTNLLVNYPFEKTLIYHIANY
jgi:hypothetical protein